MKVILYVYANILSALRAVQNQLRHEVNRLHRENIQLESSINRLGVQVEG